MVKKDYGKYCCTENCSYVVHSKCAIRKDVWDGKELEKVPEEEEEEAYENLNFFQVIGDGIIQHFSHSHHHMRLEKMYDEYKRCHACVLPFYGGGEVYNCMDSNCDFVLHEVCANLPRTKYHMAHPYPFILQVSDNKNCFYCEYCHRFSYGFRYVCESISLDVRCAAISEPFNHQSYPHPLFLSNEFGKYRSCSMCKKDGSITLNSQYDFSLCFYCATLPYKVRYEHAEHFLTLSYAKESELDLGYQDWCEVCEKTIDEWIYTCTECVITFHIACLLGKCAFYVNPAQNRLLDGKKINIIMSNGFTRPICSKCKRRCSDKLMLLCEDNEVVFCYRHWEVYDI
ncbi:unnamed protein product [Eruca vesicaria subsp. sativa]|uniref:Cysteine/Histidine-rich C1 domain family protein n=1 Tax=Eruca vesicaria subsp. sativa TaxID=29727 RepID=A0ABC8JLZ0_ERUVS|nr:unnamed protein product [Eruca vesicaria subsp. sativa]